MASVDKPIRLILVAPLPPPNGGIATSTVLLLDQLRMIPGLSTALVDSAVRWRRPTQTGLGFRLAGGAVQAWRIWRQLVRVCASGVDVVHLTTSGGPGFVRDALVLRLLQKRGIPSVISIHMGRLPSILAGKGYEKLFARAALSAATEVAVLDECSMESVRTLNSHLTVSKHPNFVDLRQLQGPAIETASSLPSAYDVLYAGFVTRTKGVMELVRASLRFFGFRLALVGPVEKDFADLLRRQAEGSGVNLSIHGAVERTRVLEMMTRSRALALPSYSEGFPYVVLEAMALGRPVIATPVGAIPEMLALGTGRACGRAVAIRDVASLQSALASLLAAPEEWSEMGQRGYERVLELYSPEAVVPALLEMWKRVATAGRNVSLG